MRPTQDETVDWLDDPNSPPPDDPGDRFSDGIELDDGGPADPAQALWDALARDDDQRAIGAFRLLEATGRKPDLEPALALELAGLLERHELFLDAARVCRMAAESDLDGPEAAPAILRAAKLLLGPARNRAAGEAMLRLLVERFATHRSAAEAVRLLERIEHGLPTGLETASGDGVVPHLATDRAAVAQASEQPVTGGSLAQAIQGVTGRVGSDRWRLLARGVQVVLLTCAAVYAVSWFLRDRYQSVDDIDPSVLQDPRQTPAADKGVIQFSRDDYFYRLTPKFDYTISGLIVSLKDYTFMSVRQSDEVFPMDLCLIWGDNVKRRVHQSSNVSFEQHGRFCLYRYTSGARVSNSSLSNNHLLLANRDQERILDRLAPGDQVRIRGQLVDVQASLLGEGGHYDPKRFKLISSVSRTDTQGGACEIIYVRQIEILERAHPLAWALSAISFWTMLGLLLLAGLRFIVLPVRLREIR